MSPRVLTHANVWPPARSVETAPSELAPFACPAGSVLTPPTEADRTAEGFERFHCYSAAQLATFDAIFALDHGIGAQNAGIIYSAPPFYRHPNCTGFIFGKDAIKG